MAAKRGYVLVATTVFATTLLAFLGLATRFPGPWRTPATASHFSSLARRGAQTFNSADKR